MILIKNKSGFSLLEMIIAMGLAVGLLVFYMKMQSEQAKVALTTKVNQEVETFFTDFKAVISRPGFCSKSFENTNFSDNAILTILNIKNPRGDIRYLVGELYGNKYVKLTGINLKNFKADDHEGLEGIATLELTLERLGKIYGAKTLTKSMELSVSRDQSKKILACGPLGSLGSLGSSIQIIQVPTKNDKTPETNPNISDASDDPKADLKTDPTPAPLTVTPANTAAQQAEILKALQNDPQFKQMQEALKSIQNQNQNIDLESDE